MKEIDIGFIIKKRIKTERNTTIQVQCLEGEGSGSVPTGAL